MILAASFLTERHFCLWALGLAADKRRRLALPLKQNAFADSPGSDGPGFAFCLE
jgi:hypothetical protein